MMNWTLNVISIDSIILFEEGRMMRPLRFTDPEEFIQYVQQYGQPLPIPVMKQGDAYILLDDQDDRILYKTMGYQMVVARVYPPMPKAEQEELIRHPYIPQYSPAKGIEQDEKPERLVMSAQSAHSASMVPAWLQQ